MIQRVFTKLILAFLLVIVAATVIGDFFVRRAWEASLRQEITTALEHEVRMFALRVDHAEGAAMPTLAKEAAAATEARATIIEPGGRVLADSEADPAKMENHAGRPEFVAALHGSTGSDARTSRTLGIEFLYVAAPTKTGAVRLAYPLTSIHERLASVRRSILLASVLAFLASLVLAAALAQSVSRRLNRIVQFAERITAGDFSARIAEPGRDEVAQVAGVLDATARKLETTFAQLESSRAQLERLLESIQHPVVSVTADSRMQWMNAAFRAAFPYAQNGELLLESCRDPQVLEAIRESASNPPSKRARSETAVPGRVYDFIASALPGGGAVVVFHDVTELEKVEKTRRDFIANVSHELRTPLTSLQGYTEMLLDSAISPDGRDFLEVIRKNAARMSRLTEDLLTLARVESGEHKMKLAAIPAAELLDEALHSLQPVAAGRSLQLEMQTSINTRVLADRDAIHQVFANLIENAMKYGQSGGRIEIGARNVDHQVEFYVRDFGPGIPFEHQPRLFERFYRVDSARSRDMGGTGLGLAIVKHIVLNHRGSVRVESELNHGATFFFSVPIAAS